MDGNRNAGQLALDLGDGPTMAPRPPKTVRAFLFFAVLPDAESMERAHRLAADLRREHALTEKLRPSSLLHMTLCPVAEISTQPENWIALATRAGDRVGGAAFTMTLDEVFSFKQDRKRKHPIVLCAAGGNDAFRMLHQRLAQALQNSGMKVSSDQHMKPHMTLAYKGKEIARTRLASPILLKATEFVLICSHHGEGRHEHLGRWPLLEPDRCMNTSG